MKSLSIISLLFFTATSFAQIVTFNDATFKALLVSDVAINTNNDSDIQVAEAIAYTDSIVCDYLSISDLTGIESFINIQLLNCSGNSLTSLNLPVNAQLKYLNSSENNLDSIDISMCPNLISFETYDNTISTIDLSSNDSLELLDLTANLLTQIDLQYLNSLEYLNLTANSLIEINIDNNPNLEFLSVSQNATLDTLNLGVKDSLIELNMGYCQISNVDLSGVVNLEQLSMIASDLVYLDLSANPELEILRLAYNDFISLDLGNNLKLKQLHFNNNPIESIDLSNNVLLEYVRVNSCPNLKELDFSNNPNFTYLRADQNNQMEAVNLANGNNVNMTYCKLTPNSLLNCIQVDDPAYSNATSSWQKKASAIYSLDCSYCLDTYTDIDTSICAFQSLMTNNGSLLSSTGIYFDTLSRVCSGDSILRIDLTVFSADTGFLTEVLCLGDSIDFYGQNISSGGVYYYTFAKLNGCDSVLAKTFDEVSIKIMNNNGTLEATTGLDTYQWFKDGIALTNETNDFYLPFATGTYHCAGQKDSCDLISNTLDVDLGTGIHSVDYENLIIYPNPIKDVLNVETTEAILVIRLLNLTGQAIKEFNPSLNQLDFTAISQGIYFLEIANAQNSSIIKIVKQ